MGGMRNFAVWVIVALMLFTLFNIFQGPRSNAASNEINFSQFTAQVDAGNIADVTIEGDGISGHYSDGSSFKTFAPPNDPSLVQRLQERGVAITARPDRSGSPTLLGVLISWFPMLLLIGVWVFFMRQMQGGGRGAMGFGKSKAKLLTEAHGRVTFDDVAGIDEAKDDLLEIVEFLKDPAKFQRLGGRIPKGALLVGPPGTGKTLLARAIAGEANVPFFSISGSDFVEMFVGVGASRVRDMFEQAKSNAPCIIFIDEIDAVGRHRGAGLGGGNDERSRPSTSCLSKWTGLRPMRALSSSLPPTAPTFWTRHCCAPVGLTGRWCPIRTLSGAKKSESAYEKNAACSDVEARTIARGTPGFSGADLANLVNEAALLAARRAKRLVSMQNLKTPRTR